jgi:DNA polymerase III delta prime subunit
MINYQIKNWLAEDNPAPLLVTSHSQATLDQAISIVSGASPDHLIVPADEKTIAIKNIRAALAASHHTSLTGGRVIIIPEAAKLTTPAANALLKVLEEPPSATRFLLTTRWSRRLLPTIRSRCQLVRLLLPTDNRTASDNEVNSPTGEEVLPKSLLERLGRASYYQPNTWHTFA